MLGLDHCAILAWLLDPRRPHGLGASLLRRVLDQALRGEFPERELASARVETEISRASTRADLVVTWQRTIVFEVKIDSVERPRQCDDLVDAWGSTVRYVFLTPTGRDPDTARKSHRRWGTLSFREVKTVLADLCRAIRKQGCPSRGFGAVESYLETLRKEFP